MKMKYLFCFLVLLCFFSTSFSKSEELEILTGKDKIQNLNGRILDGVVNLNSELYAQLGLRPDRPYHLFLMFTALNDKYGCDVCKQVAPEFTILAESYTSALRNYNTKGRDGLNVYFALLDYDSNQISFGVHDINSAPHLVYVPPNREEDTGKTLPTKFEIPQHQMYSVYQQGKAAENMLSFVKTKCGADFKIQRSQLFAYSVFGALAVTILSIVYAVITNFQAVLNRLRRKRLWITVSFLFYGLSVSGMVYCIIREPPAFSAEQNGRVKLFHPGGRQQFVFEGLIIGAYDVTSAVCMILLSQWAIFIKNPARRYLAIFICLLGFGIAYKLMVGAYTFKNRWYSTWF